MPSLGKVKLGRDATAAAGPGVTAATVGGDVLTYGRAKGLVAGVSLGDATMARTIMPTRAFTGKPSGARDILRENAVRPTAAGEAFVDWRFSQAGPDGPWMEGRRHHAGQQIPAPIKGSPTLFSGPCL